MKKTHFDYKRERFNRKADKEVKALFEEGAKVVIDVNKNSSGKTTRYLKFLKESKSSVALVVNNHKHGIEKANELRELPFLKFTDFVHLMGLENACTAFKTINGKGEEVIDSEKWEQAQVYRHAGFDTTKIHSIMHPNGKHCPYKRQWTRFNKMKPKKAILSQHMLESLGGGNQYFDYIILDEVDGLLGFGESISKEEVMEIDIKFEKNDPEPLRYNLEDGTEIKVPLKEVSRKDRKAVDYQYRDYCLKYADKTSSQIQNDENYDDLLKVIDKKAITDDVYLIEGKDKIQKNVEYKKISLLSKILLTLSNPVKITIDEDGNIISYTLDVKSKRLDIIPKIIIASARMRNNFLMDYQLQIAFETALLKAQKRTDFGKTKAIESLKEQLKISEDEKLMEQLQKIGLEQIEDLRKRMQYYPEKPDPKDFPTDDDANTYAFVVDPKKSISKRNAVHEKNIGENLESFVQGWQAFHNHLNNVKPDRRHKIRIITYGDLIDLLHNKDVFKKLEKITWKGKGSKKIFELFTSSSNSTEWVAFGGQSAGSNPGNDVKYIYIFGDWLNGEYTSFLQYMFYNGDPYTDFTNPGRNGFQIKAKGGKEVPFTVRMNILDIIGLEYKEYILASRLKKGRHVLIVSHLIAGNFDTFEIIFRKFNIKLVKIEK